MRWGKKEYLLIGYYISVTMCLAHRKCLRESAECNTKFDIHIEVQGIYYCFLLQLGKLSLGNLNYILRPQNQ